MIFYVYLFFKIFIYIWKKLKYFDIIQLKTHNEMLIYFSIQYLLIMEHLKLQYLDEIQIFISNFHIRNIYIDQKSIMEN